MLLPAAACKEEVSSTFIFLQLPSNNLPPLISKRGNTWLRDLKENALIEAKQFLGGIAKRVLADHFNRREQVLHVKILL